MRNIARGKEHLIFLLILSLIFIAGCIAPAPDTNQEAGGQKSKLCGNEVVDIIEN